ncbi:excitatory amino acid transporter 3-like [Liolophura sinensis]|uniref:excitatory amino acid transporter 3-like n=1 Tax=Liolophura sinensis TaxID=3198878 RepID=UPI003158E153
MSTASELPTDYDQTSKFSDEESCGQKAKRFFRKNLLLVLLILAMFLGIGMGAGLRYVQPPFNSRQIMYLRFPGDLLMQMLKMLILPLIVSSLISGLAALDTRSSGRIGLRAVVYYMTTTLAAVILGIILVVAIRPGDYGRKDNIERSGEAKNVNPADAMLDLVRVMFPDNLIQACFSRTVTEQIPVNQTDDVNLTSVANMSVFVEQTSDLIQNATNKTAAPQEFEPKLVTVDGINIMGLVVFSIFFGIIIGRMGEKGRPLVELFDSLNIATMKLISLVIWYSPIGVTFLIAAKVVEMEDPEAVIQQIGMYALTVLSGLAIHGLIVLPLLYFVIVRKNPFKYLYGIIQALVTALATSSSSATLPLTMQCLEENNGIDPRIIKFVAPVGATINMDGTALYEAVAAIFIGQINQMSMDVGKVITVSITATAAAIGAAGVPQAGLVTMVIVLSAVGLPTDDVTLILAIDWFLDRFRTMINVLGDGFGCGIVAHLSRGEMAKMDTASEMEKDMSNGHHNDGYETGF